MIDRARVRLIWHIHRAHGTIGVRGGNPLGDRFPNGENQTDEPCGRRPEFDDRRPNGDDGQMGD
ncbi:MAG: hypothetical protein ABFC96_10360 [Thermoguttaceae bacterium]